MEQQGNTQEEKNELTTLSKVKDNIKDKVHAVRSKLHSSSEADETHLNEHSNSPSSVDRSNIEDFPYDGTCEDPFSIELASVADEQIDEVGSPMSQDSGRRSFNSTVSGVSWTSTQKTIAGLGMDEVRSQEVLGPYKRVGSVQALEAVPTEYRDYNNNRDRDGFHASGISSFARSPSQSSTHSISSSLYNDLSSISDRDLQVPEGIIKADGFDCEFDKEFSPSPIQSSGMEQDISKMQLNGST